MASTHSVSPSPQGGGTDSEAQSSGDEQQSSQGGPSDGGSEQEVSEEDQAMADLQGEEPQQEGADDHPAPWEGDPHYPSDDHSPPEDDAPPKKKRRTATRTVRGKGKGRVGRNEIVGRGVKDKDKEIRELKDRLMKVEQLLASKTKVSKAKGKSVTSKAKNTKATKSRGKR